MDCALLLMLILIVPNMIKMEIVLFALINILKEMEFVPESVLCVKLIVLPTVAV